MFAFGGLSAQGVRTFPTVATLPLTGVLPGTLAHVEQNLAGESALYLWSGTQLSGGWYKVATVNLAPALTHGPDTSYALPNDGTPLTIALSAEDPEGLPIAWSYQVTEGSIDGVATVAREGGTFTVSADPDAISAQAAGAFSLTFVASDGVSLSAATSAFTLTFVLKSKYLVVGHDTSPFMSAYDVSGDSPVRLQNPATLPGNARSKAAWHPSRQIFSLPSTSSGVSAEAFYRIGAAGIERFYPSGVPVSGALGAAFSPSGEVYARALSSAPFIQFFAWSGEDGTLLPNPATLPPDTARCVAFSPDGRYCAVGHNVSPFLTVYDFASGSPVKLPNPATLPAGIGFSVSWSPDSRYLALGHGFSPFMRVYEVVDGSILPGPTPDVAPGAAANLAFSPDGRFLAAGSTASPFVLLYERGDGATLTALPSTWVGSIGQVTCLDFSADSGRLIVGHNTSPFAKVYDTTGASPVLIGDLTGVAGISRGATYAPGE